MTIPRGRLLAFLGVATFFEGFDVTATAQVLPVLGRPEGFGLSEEAKGLLIGAIGVGPMLAWLLVREADRRGRRPLMLVSLAGYALATLCSGLAPGAWLFGACQVVARAFLVGEWALAMVYAAEEFPASERARVMALLHGLALLGGIVCAAVVPLMVKSAWGWRSVFLAGVAPLLLLLLAGSSLPETERFRSGQVERAPAGGVLEIWRTAWAGRLALASVAWACTYVCVAPAITFWKQFSVGERGFTDGQFVQASALASLLSVPLVFASGRWVERWGRRRSAAVLFPLTGASVAAAYSLHGFWPLALSLAVALFTTSAIVPLLNAWTAELFPTHLRAGAFAWSNTLLGRVGSVLGPMVMGQVAGSVGWGLPVALSGLGPLLAAGLLLWRFPETRGRELEETSKVTGA